MSRKHLLWAACAALGGTSATAFAAPPEDDVQKQLDDVRRQMAGMSQRYEARIADLEKRLREHPDEGADLQDAIDDLLDRVDELDTRVAAARTAPPPTLKLLDISFNSLLAAGTSSAPNDRIFEGLEGGHHDPHRRGFTIQNTEISLMGAVDPYFKGFANMVQTIDEKGETVVELEEAYAQTTSLPAGLQVKAGQYFTEFGRQNAQHPHQWDFVDQPVVNSRVFGDDGMRGPGARVSWFAPTGFPLELLAGLQNGVGNTMRSFAGPAEDGPPVGTQVERDVRTFRDLVWTGRADASFDLDDETPVLVGVSGAFGPSGASDSASTSIIGADFTLKWKPLANDHGFPFVAFQSEWMRRHVGFDSFVEGGAFTPGGELHDSGEYAQVVYGFQRDWTAGLRYDRVQGTDDDTFGMDDRNRWSVAITYYASEFAKIRLQVNVDDSAALPRRVTSVWLQFEFNLGTHGAHRF